MEREDNNLNVFNTAKKFSEELLFPIMINYQKFKRQSDFGSENLDNAKLLNDEIKDIERYNGLKGMNDSVGALFNAISSTVRLKGNLKEVAKLNEIKEIVDKVKNLFYKKRERFFITVTRGLEIKETLDRDYFEAVKDIIDANYINTEILMTRNKLLFSDAKDEYLSDEEIREEIRKEYVEG